MDNQKTGFVYSQTAVVQITFPEILSLPPQSLHPPPQSLHPIVVVPDEVNDLPSERWVIFIIKAGNELIQLMIN